MAMDFKKIPEGFLLAFFENFCKVFLITIADFLNDLNKMFLYDFSGDHSH